MVSLNCSMSKRARSSIPQFPFASLPKSSRSYGTSACR
jgi:hypothetical protein